MVDNNNRIINYLRLSVTDKCNLRCIYCMSEEGVEFMPHAEILTYEEMFVIIKLCIKKGIRKLRLTGGEPLIRKGVIDFIKKVSELDGLEEVTLTTNGVYLKEFALPETIRYISHQREYGYPSAGPFFQHHKTGFV